jgi:hypothetical protein
MCFYALVYWFQPRVPGLHVKDKSRSCDDVTLLWERSYDAKKALKVDITPMCICKACFHWLRYVVVAVSVVGEGEDESNILILGWYDDWLPSNRQANILTAILLKRCRDTGLERTSEISFLFLKQLSYSTVLHFDLPYAIPLYISLEWCYSKDSIPHACDPFSGAARCLHHARKFSYRVGSLPSRMYTCGWWPTQANSHAESGCGASYLCDIISLWGAQTSRGVSGICMIINVQAPSGTRRHTALEVWSIAVDQHEMYLMSLAKMWQETDY